MKRVHGYPRLRKDEMGVVHVIDPKGLEKAKAELAKVDEVQSLKEDIAELKAMMKRLQNK